MKANNEAIAHAFYSAFRDKDAQAMNKYYHQDVRFEDPVFGKLDYTQVCGMWLMLCESAKDLVIDYRVIKSDENTVECKWVAEYTFGKTGRFVHNEITATMVITDGLIIKHSDKFNLHGWAKQALGFQGLMLGSTGYFKRKLQQQTNRQLAKYLKNKRSLN